MDIQSRFVTEAPTAQAALDLFAGDWSSAMPIGSGLTSQPGHAGLFNDSRIHWADQQLSFEGKTILELGPLEGAHSCMIQQLRAESIIAIEANTRAFLKCLCIKEIFALNRVQFKLGSFIPYLKSCKKFDIIIASGVLYHMTEPLKLLELLVARSNRIFLWTHYFDEHLISSRSDRDAFAPMAEIDGSSYRGSKKLYPEAALSWSGFSGGTDSYAIWLERESLLRFFSDRGYAVSTAFDQIDHVNGPALALCAVR